MDQDLDSDFTPTHNQPTKVLTVKDGLFLNGRLLNPNGIGTDNVGSLTVKNGVIQQWQPGRSIASNAPVAKHDQIIDLQGQWLTPHFFDIGAQLREPGFEHKGTLTSESNAAFAGGFQGIAMLPDTSPVMDSPAVVGLIQERAKHLSLKVWPMAAMTLGLNGTQLSEMFALKAAGCIAITQSRRPLSNNRLALRCLEYIATTGLKVLFYSEDHELAGDGCAHEGPIADRLGLSGIPECAETTAIARDLLMVERTGVTAHFGHLSSARSLELIEDAQQKGLPVTADVALTHLIYDERALLNFNPQYHLRPPLRSNFDRKALLDGVNRGAISISIGHQPQDIASKTAPFSESEAGMSLYDVHISMAKLLIEAEQLNPLAWVKALTTLPAHFLNQTSVGLNIGDQAAFNVISDEVWTPNRQSCCSLGGNIPGFKQSTIGRLSYRVSA